MQNPPVSKPPTACVVWITGLSGVGKTTVARALHTRWQAEGRQSILLDGDALREAFGGTFGHTAPQRRKASLTYARLCKLLSGQGIPVICATISLFHETHAWNRANIPFYVEIHLRAPLNVLKARDHKNVYSPSGQDKNVMGIDIAPQEPLTPDIVIENHGSATVEQAVQTIETYLKRHATSADDQGNMHAKA
jgi:cytidine diphosphoramidate kinase